MQAKDHWEKNYSTKAANAVSWFQPPADFSVGLINATGVSRDASIIDVGGGASTLIGDLLTSGFAKQRYPSCVIVRMNCMPNSANLSRY